MDIDRHHIHIVTVNVNEQGKEAQSGLSIPAQQENYHRAGGKI